MNRLITSTAIPARAVKTCAAREIPALQRNIDAHWYARHAAAVTPAEREALNMEERAMRFQPREWTQ